MDAESRRRRRESSISLREQRWSMSSQRLEQIVAELMKPVSHYGQSFDRDDSGLLEEYLTAAGVRALEAVEAGGEAPAPPNYAEMGLVIQSFANNYCKKVDHLSRLVNSFSQTLDSNNVPRSPDAEEDPDRSGESPSDARRRRASSTGAGAGAGAGGAFTGISLSAAASARRGGSPPGPPPTLPRVYAELQPRAAAPDRLLPDYDGEPIGALDDFRAAWRLHNGYLVEELAGGAAGGAELRPLSLMELQEACARAAAPAPPPDPPHTPPASPPASPAPPCAPSPPAAPPPAALRRKRRSEAHVEDLLIGSLNIDVDDAVRQQCCEFSVSERWVRRVVRHRRDEILRARTHAHTDTQHFTEFRGFDMSWMDVGGFAGWSAAEGAAAGADAARLLRLHASLSREPSLSGGDDAQMSECEESEPAPAEGDAWQRDVARRALASAPLHLGRLARDVRRALPAPPAAVTWRALLAATARRQPQPARVLLDILMKATRGEVEIEQGPPLSVNEFSVRVVTSSPPPPSPPPSPPPPSPPPPDEP